jgi:hypothetical protein
VSLLNSDLLELLSLEHGRWDAPPPRARAQGMDVQQDQVVYIHVGEELRDTSRRDAENDRSRVPGARGTELQENEPADHATRGRASRRCASDVVVRHHVAALEVPEGM